MFGLFSKSKYGYVKVKVTDYTAGFVIYSKKSKKYRKITIAAGHPDNTFKRIRNTTSDEYYNYGEYYSYNGNNDIFIDVFEEFNPKSCNIQILMDNLSTECDLEKYKSLWDKMQEWATYVATVATKTAETTKSVLSAIPLIGWFFSTPQSALPAPDPVPKLTYC